MLCELNFFKVMLLKNDRIWDITVCILLHIFHILLSISLPTQHKTPAKKNFLFMFYSVQASLCATALHLVLQRSNKLAFIGI